MLERYFPWGIAEGKAFLGRNEEIDRLKNNIQRGYHTLLLAPRRFGKTSLAKHVIKQLSFPYVEIDLFVAQDEFGVEHKFLKGVQSIINQIDKPEKGFQALMSYFKKSNKTWTIGIKGFQVELIPDNHKNIPENILEALNSLEFILAKKNLRAVIFIDEFQEIATVKMNRALEGAIRHFAQSSKHVVFIFSGSRKDMLKHIFSDKSRPLYALCDEIPLKKLSAEDYFDYLNEVASETWKKQIPPTVFNAIMKLTESHPRYVYMLCLYFWHQCSSTQNPTVKAVNLAWKKIINERAKDTREILVGKSPSHVKLLTLIATAEISELTGREAQIKIGISGSAISQALKTLESEDFLEKNINKQSSQTEYKFVDPLLKATLIEYGDDHFIH